MHTPIIPAIREAEAGGLQIHEEEGEGKRVDKF